jgi:hypothetical protein
MRLASSGVPFSCEALFQLIHWLLDVLPRSLEILEDHMDFVVLEIVRGLSDPLEMESAIENALIVESADACQELATKWGCNMDLIEDLLHVRKVCLPLPQIDEFWLAPFPAIHYHLIATTPRIVGEQTLPLVFDFLLRFRIVLWQNNVDYYSYTSWVNLGQGTEGDHLALEAEQAAVVQRLVVAILVDDLDGWERTFEYHVVLGAIAQWSVYYAVIAHVGNCVFTVQWLLIAAILFEHYVDTLLQVFYTARRHETRHTDQSCGHPTMRDVGGALLFPGWPSSRLQDTGQ